MDKKALKILFNAYWSSGGWNDGRPKLTPESFDYAKSHGLMFDPVRLEHDETLSRLQVVVEKLTLAQVAGGFLASLSTRRLEWRSALGSYSVARWLPAHKPSVDRSRECQICGLYCGKAFQDLNVLNFERFKWGGIRHNDPIYALLDLELFLENPAPAPQADDLKLLRSLITAIENAPASATGSSLHKYFPSVLKANKAERDQIVAILGLCGVLDTPDHPGFAQRFIPESERLLPDRLNVEMAYPACWWTSSVGINYERLVEVFGQIA